MALFERHLDLGRALPASPWRKIAIGTWRTAKDPSVYGVLPLDVTAAQAWIEARAAGGAKITLSHFLGKAVAEALRRHPQINAVLRFGRLYPRQSVTLFFQVAADAGGVDLSGVTVRDAEKKSVEAIAAEMAPRVNAVRDQSDVSYKRMKSLMGLLPGWLTSVALDFAGFLQFSLNVWTPLLGTPKDPLGSVMITNVGTLGLGLAFAPLVAYSRVPLIIAAGAVKDEVVAERGAPVVRPIMRLGVTFDHRLIDGVHAAKLAKTVEAIFADPRQLEAAPPSSSPGAKA